MFLEIKQTLSLNLCKEYKIMTLAAYKVETVGVEPTSQ